jgi:hypothetical protein
MTKNDDEIIIAKEELRRVLHEDKKDPQIQMAFFKGYNAAIKKFKLEFISTPTKNKTEDNILFVYIQILLDCIKCVSEMCSLSLYKNRKYGNSALKPIKVFCKSDAEASITVRLDDKLSRMINAAKLTDDEKKQFIKLFSRVMGGDTLKENDVKDMIGYQMLLCVLKGWLGSSQFKD